MRAWLPTLAMAFAPITALAAPEYLKTVSSDVYQTTGSTSEIAARASICIAQTLAPGIQGGQLILSDDRANGVIVANNVVKYADGFLRWTLRSRFTFEAKDGRFRIEHTGIERISDTHTLNQIIPDEWGPVGTWRAAGAGKVQSILQQSSDDVAKYVQAKAGADW